MSYRLINELQAKAYLSHKAAACWARARQAVQEEIRRELAWLQGYDLAFSKLNDELDLPQKDLSALIRMSHSNKRTHSAHRRKQQDHLPEAVLNRVEEMVRLVFEASWRSAS